MTQIYSSEDLPPRRLQIQALHQCNTRLDYGSMIQMQKENMARRIAQVIVDEKKFYDISIENDLAKMRVDVMVLTQDEYADIMRKQFKAGLNHAAGFMPMEYK